MVAARPAMAVTTTSAPAVPAFVSAEPRPRGSDASTCGAAANRGAGTAAVSPSAVRLATRPGTAAPPPRLRRRAATRTARPITTAGRYLTDPARAAAGRDGTGLLEVVAERLGAGGVAQLRHRLRLDLPDPLTR